MATEKNINFYPDAWYVQFDCLHFRSNIWKGRNILDYMNIENIWNDLEVLEFCCRGLTRKEEISIFLLTNPDFLKLHSQFYFWVDILCLFIYFLSDCWWMDCKRQEAIGGIILVKVFNVRNEDLPEDICAASRGATKTPENIHQEFWYVYEAIF